MRWSCAIGWAVVCLSQVCLAQPGTVKIPPLQEKLTLEGQPVAVALWGSVSPGRLSATVDLGDFEEHLTPILATQLNRSDKCGERLTVQHVALAPSGLLTANVHFERYACAKAMGKEIVKRLVGGNAVVEVQLTPAVDENRIAMNAEVRKIDADGSLGEALRSGSFGDSIRQKIAAAIESSIRKSADLKPVLPEGIERVASLRAVRFTDGGAGRLWLTIDADLHLPAEQFQALARQMAGR